MINIMNSSSLKITDEVLAAKTFLYGVFVFLDINVDTVKILSILMAIDTILGVFKVIRLGNKFSFKKLIWGMITKVSVLIVPMVLALTAKALNFDFTWFVSAVLNILVLAEAFSSITNIISIKEAKELENTDFITRLLHKVRQGLSTLINQLFGTITQDNNEKNENNDFSDNSSK